MDLIRIRCGGEKLFIFLVYAPHVYDANEADDLEYKILPYTLTVKDKAVTQIKALDKDLSKMVEVYNGSASLAVQSSPDGKRHYALMPHNFSSSPWIDELTPEATDNYVWSSSKMQFMGRYYIGSNMAYRPNTNGKGYAFGGGWTQPIYDDKGGLIQAGLSGAYVRANCGKARNIFRTVTVNVEGKDTKKTYYDFDIESITIGQVMVWAGISQELYRPMRKNYIRYREVPEAVPVPPNETEDQRKKRVSDSFEDPSWVRGPLVGAADTWQGEYGHDGFGFKYTVAIAALDIDKALVRTVERKVETSMRTEDVRVTRILHQLLWQVVPAGMAGAGQHLVIRNSTTAQHLDFTTKVWNYTTTECEDLKIGDTVLETLSVADLYDDDEGFAASLVDIRYGTTPIDSYTATFPNKYMGGASIGYATTDFGDSFVSGYYSGDFPYIGEVPVRDNWQYPVAGVTQGSWGDFVATKHYSVSVTGSGGINVMMYDNLNGDETWIILYKTQTYDKRGSYQGPPINGVYGTYRNETTTTYKMAYRITRNVKDSAGRMQSVQEPVEKKDIATQTNTDTGRYILGGYANIQIVAQTDGNPTLTGEYVSAVSCRIGQGIIAYSYNVYEAERGKFKRRVMGIINIDRREIAPNAVFEADFKDDDPRLNDFRHDRLAAIGVGAGNLAGNE
jgi:hypothetical protein